MMVHRGEIVEKAVRESGMTIVQLAKRMNMSRKWVYNAFENAHLSLDYILEIGKIIHYDFSRDIPEIYRPQQGMHQDVEMAYSNPEETVGYWKTKYYKLLEEYTELLRR